MANTIKIEEFKSVPVIYNFHADEYRTVETAEEIKEFEFLMRRGARVKDFDFSEENIRASGTTSCSGGCADDCDAIAH